MAPWTTHSLAKNVTIIPLIRINEALRRIGKESQQMNMIREEN